MPFLTAKAPVRNGSVKSFRASAAAGDWERMGSPAVFWLNRLGLPRAGAVVHPYLTPRFAIKGRSASGKASFGVFAPSLLAVLVPLCVHFVEK